MMMETKHTPGPWYWDAGIVPPDGPETYADIYVDGGDTIIAGFNDFIPEGRANARLLSAAPDLLAALQTALVWLEYDGRYDVQGIRAAIAKATSA
jgi:hypothetical protein